MYLFIKRILMILGIIEVARVVTAVRSLFLRRKAERLTHERQVDANVTNMGGLLFLVDAFDGNAARTSGPAPYAEETARERTSEETQSPPSAPAWTFGH